MSDDQWNKPGAPPSQSPHDQNDWDVESDLPKPGESWSTGHSPKPIHEVDDNWGTAPFDGSVQHPSPQQPQQPFGQPPQQPGPQGHYQQQPPPGAYPPNQGQPYPQNQGAPGGYPPNQMTYQPNTAMSNSAQLDNNDILAIVVSLFVPGAGHIILGQTGKGIAIIAAMILTCGIAAIAWPVVLIDAVMLAQAKKKRPVDDWEFFPK